MKPRFGIFFLAFVLVASTAVAAVAIGEDQPTSAGAAAPEVVSVKAIEQRLLRAEAIEQAQAEADFVAWVTAAKKAEDEAKWYAAVAEAERIAHEAWHAEQDRLAAERRAAAAEVKAAQTTRTPTPEPSAAVQGPEMGSGRCGGDLPPCYVMERESGGDIRIWNGGCYAPYGYTGRTSPCGGSTASGKWQFIRGTWNGYGGYLNAADAPESVQDAKARELWAGGRGCSHWAAC